MEKLFLYFLRTRAAKFIIVLLYVTRALFLRASSQRCASSVRPRKGKNEARGVSEGGGSRERGRRGRRGRGDERAGQERIFRASRATTTVHGGDVGNCEKARQFCWAEWCAKQTVVARRPSNHARGLALRSFQRRDGEGKGRGAG